jgi:endoglucanase
VTLDGRVIDTGNGGISHSEGQGYGMLLAAGCGDRERFDRIWAWTRRSLQVRDDRLFAWKWQPQAGGGGAVADRNDASDGDLLVAWALRLAAETWQVPAYRLAADLVLADVKRLLVVDSRFGPVLLPGTQGFAGPGKLVVNPSYWVYPALAAAARADADPVWGRLAASRTAILGAARFGEHTLPPDWLDIAAEAKPAAGFPPVFGFNAIRVPLYLSWSEQPDRPELMAPFLALPAAFGGPERVPATIDVLTGKPAEYPLPAGGQAVLRLAAARAAGARPDLPALDPKDDYYSSTLLLLTKLTSETAP